MLHHRSTQITKGWKKSAIQLVSPSLINLLGTVYGGLTRHVCRIGRTHLSCNRVCLSALLVTTRHQTV